MNTPTHEEIALQALNLWQERGRPAGCDTEIWLEAERQASAGPRPSAVPNADAFTTSVRAETAAESVVEYHLSSAESEQDAILAALQKQEARAPQVAHHTGPRAKPPETGKPLWNQPHSS